MARHEDVINQKLANEAAPATLATYLVGLEDKVGELETKMLEIAGVVDGPLPLLRNQPESEATSIAAIKADFNALLGALKVAGLMEADADEITVAGATKITEL